MFWSLYRTEMLLKECRNQKQKKSINNLFVFWNIKTDIISLVRPMTKSNLRAARANNYHKEQLNKVKANIEILILERVWKIKTAQKKRKNPWNKNKNHWIFFKRKKKYSWFFYTFSLVLVNWRIDCIFQTRSRNVIVLS